MPAPRKSKDPIGEFYAKAGSVIATEDDKTQAPRTFYEKGRYFLDLRNRPLSALETAAVLIGAAVVILIGTNAIIAILK